jgi:ribonuclease-3
VEVVDASRIASLKDLEKNLNINFNRIELLSEALTHTSYAYEVDDKNIKHNERLEFLGDSVLSLIISEYIFEKYPDRLEGELAKIRAAVVSRSTLTNCAKRLNLGKYLQLGRGEELTGGRKRESILADAFEAIIGALYLDSGFEVTKGFVIEWLKDEIERSSRNECTRDYKTMLQEWTQSKYKILPQYKVLKVKGPDHKQIFEVCVSIKGKVLGHGTGRSKKEAEQQAASKALKRLENEPIFFPEKPKPKFSRKKQKKQETQKNKTCG